MNNVPLWDLFLHTHLHRFLSCGVVWWVDSLLICFGKKAKANISLAHVWFILYSLLAVSELMRFCCP